MRRIPPIYPVLVGIFAVLVLYYTNFDVVLSGKEIVWSLLLTTGFISLLLGLGYLVFRTWYLGIGIDLL